MLGSFRFPSSPEAQHWQALSPFPDGSGQAADFLAYRSNSELLPRPKT